MFEPKVIIGGNAGMRRRGDTDMAPWQYHVGYAVEEALREGYFTPALDNLLLGDSIRMSRIEKNGADYCITEVLDLIVIARDVGAKSIVVGRLIETIKYPLPKTDTGTAAEIPDEVYVPEDCEAEFKGPARLWEVIGTSGTIYTTKLEDGDEAKSIARGDLPIPIKEAA